MRILPTGTMETVCLILRSVFRRGILVVGHRCKSPVIGVGVSKTRFETLNFLTIAPQYRTITREVTMWEIPLTKLPLAKTSNMLRLITPGKKRFPFFPPLFFLFFFLSFFSDQSLTFSSVLHITWTNQHGCGGGDGENENRKVR